MSQPILYICSGRSFKTGELGRKIPSIIHCWNLLNYEVQIVCGGDLENSDNSSENIAISGTTIRDSFRMSFVERLKASSFLDPVKHSISEYRDIYHDRQLLSVLERIVNDRKPRLIWERSSRLHCAGLTIAQRFGIPFALEWKDNLVSYSFSWYHNRAVKIERKKNIQANFVIVESTKLKDDLSRENIDSDKIIVALNAVEPEEFRLNIETRGNIRSQLGISDDEIVIGYLGSYAYYHDVPCLIEAIKKLYNQKVQKIKLLLIGSGAGYFETRRIAGMYNLLDSLIIMKPGVLPKEVPAYLSALDIAVLPGSTDIICPIKIQEYMSTELPTIAPDYPCNREVINDRTTGLLFKPHDASSLAEKLYLLMNDKQLRRKIGSNARKEVLKRFSWKETWGAAIEKIMEKTNK